MPTQAACRAQTGGDDGLRLPGDALRGLDPHIPDGTVSLKRDAAALGRLLVDAAVRRRLRRTQTLPSQRTLRLTQQAAPLVITECPDNHPGRRGDLTAAQPRSRSLQPTRGTARALAPSASNASLRDSRTPMRTATSETAEPNAKMKTNSSRPPVARSRAVTSASASHQHQIQPRGTQPRRPQHRLAEQPVELRDPRRLLNRC